MSTDRDVTRTVRSWLEDGATTLPDRVLDAVLVELPTTPQRRATWWPARSIEQMNTAIKFGLAAVVVVVAALLGFNYLVAPNIGGRGPDTAPSSPTPSPAVSELHAGALDPGTYAMDDPARTPVRLVFTVPAGWSTRGGDLYTRKHSEQPGEVGFFSWVVTHVYADACNSAGTLTEVGPTVDDLVNALASQAGSAAAEPVGLSIGGYAGVRVDMSGDADLDAASCRVPNVLQIWANEAETDFFAIGPDIVSASSVYIVDVEGERVVITAGGNTDASATDLAELDAIIASIRFEP
jgi:hypothetical protein